MQGVTRLSCLELLGEEEDLLVEGLGVHDPHERATLLQAIRAFSRRTRQWAHDALQPTPSDQPPPPQDDEGGRCSSSSPAEPSLPSAAASTDASPAMAKTDGPEGRVPEEGGAGGVLRAFDRHEHGAVLRRLQALLPVEAHESGHVLFALTHGLQAYLLLHAAVQALAAASADKPNHAKEEEEEVRDAWDRFRR